ncbi:hypothetical protein GCM10010503_34800 [Streptomyces lucensis JCM 4490]|uniref:Uncharacterized protein n=1 Tax=Streptomyces lucensis JCM 4490 TaxID=1306176 RepID=A0A918J9H8_9ACTN|nr:hypothetical protein GCM10010503_34800 [Streptomyces lucensis JCM 4490]
MLPPVTHVVLGPDGPCPRPARVSARVPAGPCGRPRVRDPSPDGVFPAALAVLDSGRWKAVDAVRARIGTRMPQRSA